MVFKFVYVFCSVLVLINTSTVIKKQAKLKFPESKKLEVNFTRDGAPTEVISDNEVVEMKSDIDNAKIGGESLDVMEEPIEQHEEVYPHEEHFEDTHDDLHEQNHEIDYLDDRKGNVVTVSQEYEYNHPHGAENVNIFHSKSHHPNLPKHEVYDHSVEGHTYNSVEEMREHYEGMMDTFESLGLPTDPMHYVSYENISSIEEEVKKALEETDHDGMSELKPNIVGNIVMLLDKLDEEKRYWGDNHEAPVEDTSEDESNLDNYNQVSKELEEKIEALEHEISNLKQQIEAVKVMKDHDEELGNLVDEINELESEEDNLIIQKDLEDEMGIKHELDSLKAEKGKEVKEHAREIDLADIDNRIGELEVKDAREQELIDEELVKLKEEKLEQLTKERDDLFHANADQEEIDRLSQEIDDLTNAIAELQKDHHITEEIEEELHEANQELAVLKTENNKDQEIQALENNRNELLEVEVHIEKDQEKLKEFDYPEITHSIEINSMYDNVHKIGEKTEKKSETTVPKHDNEFNLDSRDQSTHLIIPHLVIIINRIKSQFTKLIQELPKTVEEIPENTIENVEDLMLIFKKLKNLPNDLTIFTNMTRNDVVQVEKTFDNITNSFDGIMSFYKLSEELDAIENKEFLMTDEYHATKADMSNLSTQIGVVVDRLKDHLNSLKRMFELLKQNVSVVKQAIENDEPPTGEEQADIVIQIVPTLIDLREEVYERLQTIVDDMNYVRNKRIKLSNMVKELEHNAFGDEDESSDVEVSTAFDNLDEKKEVETFGKSGDYHDTRKLRVKHNRRRYLWI